MMCGKRSAGQGNYGYANSVCDMLCMSRRAAGKPALALAWGPVDHVGYVAEILKVCLFPFAYPSINYLEAGFHLMCGIRHIDAPLLPLIICVQPFYMHRH